MGFFKPRLARQSVLLVDIGSGSVGAAYLSYGGNSKAALHHAVRVPLQSTMEVGDAVKEALKRIVVEGAPHLRDAVGSGRVTRAIIAVASPWQSTVVTTARKEESAPFSFTKSILAELVKEGSKTEDGCTQIDASVLATLLNGYHLENAVGKRAMRAEAVVASSGIDATLVKEVTEKLHEAHIRDLSFITFPWLTYSVVRDLYPHEENYLIVDAAGRATDIALITHTKLAQVVSAKEGVRTLERAHGRPEGPESIESGVHIIRDLANTEHLEAGKKVWLESFLGALGKLAEVQALPRTIFLIADPGMSAYVKSLLDDPTIRSLWLSDEPLSIIPLSAANFTAKVVASSTDASDLFLLLAAFYTTGLHSGK